MSAKKANSLARWRPISRGSSHEAPKSMDRPRFEKIWEKRAVSEATTRSHPRAMLIPAPAAMPPTLAMVGLGKRCSRRATSLNARIWTR